MRSSFRVRSSLCRCENYEEAIQLIELSNVLPRLSHLLTTNIENEVLIEGRSINQARITMGSARDCETSQFPGLVNVYDADSELKIIDV